MTLEQLTQLIDEACDEIRENIIHDIEYCEDEEDLVQYWLELKLLGPMYQSVKQKIETLYTKRISE